MSTALNRPAPATVRPMNLRTATAFTSRGEQVRALLADLDRLPAEVEAANRLDPEAAAAQLAVLADEERTTWDHIAELATEGGSK
jgi:hypothetical protein